MKKGIVFTALIALFALISAQAQIRIKPHIGFNWSQLSSEPQDFTQEGRIGAMAGVGIQIGDKFYVEPAAQWALVSTDLVNSNSQNVSIENSVNLFRVPLMAGYRFLDRDAFFNIRVFTGPAANFVLSVNSTSDEVSKDDYKSMVWGWDAGVGVDVWFVYLELGYEFGLSPVFSDTNFSNAKNNAFYVAIGANLF